MRIDIHEYIFSKKIYYSLRSILLFANMDVFDGKRQELIEEGNDPVNKENWTQKPYNARLI
jgi:hypothetical protein